MNRTAAEALIVVMDTAWPAAGFLDDEGELTPRGAMYAADLEDFTPTAGAVAVESLRTSVRWSQGPTPAELLSALVTARADESQPELMLPGPTDLAEQAPPEVRANLDAYFAKFGGQDTARAAIARRRTSGPERVEAMRLVAAAQIEAERPTEPRPKNREGGMATACGVRSGTPAVQEGGVWVCPNCRSPIGEGCTPRREEATA